jgi:hypothetical protein
MLFKDRKKSILFHNPDYHCTFFYQQQLKKLGWRADILVFDSYPEKLLYDSNQIIRCTKITNNFKIDYTLWFLLNFYKYKYIFYYGRPVDYGYWFRKFRINIRIEPMLEIIKFFRIKIIYLPTGCNDEFIRDEFIKFDNGKVCNNCGFFEKCDDKKNKRNLYIVSRYADLVVGSGFNKPQFINQKEILWKSFDLEIFNPNIKVPSKFVLPKSNSFRILHSTSLEGRQLNGKNIKGSGYIKAAVERLRSEGFDCELIRLTDVNSANMRYFQIQADLIIDQLIYGQWGSTSLEAIALGKPVICYFNNEWKQNYIKSFNIEIWPFIEANTQNIYNVLKNLLTNPNELSQYSKMSIDFAHKYLDSKKNTQDFVKILKKL